MIGLKALQGIRLLITGVLALLLCGCGSAFAVRNDTGKTVYIDAIYKDHPRDPTSQALEIGNTYSTPRCWNEIAKIYVGNRPEHLTERPVSVLCKASSCNCTVNVSQL
jgi:hypothetical protein